MSLYSALYAGVSGLSAHANAMAAVADNITNINTVGYKGVDAQFATMVTDGTAKGNYSAGGVQMRAVTQISKQGLPQATGNATDISINGGGFFVTKTGLGESSSVALTRAGSFKQDEEGYLRNASGLYLQGWRLDATGQPNNNGSISSMEPVRLSDLTGTAAPTSRIQVRMNLQSSTDITGRPTDATSLAALPGKMAAYAANPNDPAGQKPDFSRSFDVYDAQGGSHSVTMSYYKTGANEWTASISSPDATPTVMASGTLKFNPDGSLDRDGSSPALFSSTTPKWLPLDAGGNSTIGSVPIEFQIGDNDGINGITQFGSESALVSSNVNGGMLGNLAAVDIGKDGVVNAIFSDGTTRAVFQLPIATFQNPDGLTRMSGNAYTVSKASGGMTLNKPGALGAGNISAGTLEASTVDLAGEFTNMIRFQRAYSASSKIITTVDDMLREVSDLKR